MSDDPRTTRATGEEPPTAPGDRVDAPPPTAPGDRFVASRVTATADHARARPASGTADAPSSRGSSGFAILETIGQGGMGTVLSAHQHSIGRDVALKVLRPDLEAGPDLEARFVDEARVTGQLEHPGIVPVHELGRDDQGRVFMAMKLVRGRSLADSLHSSPSGSDPASFDRELGERLDILLRVCDAVAFAHAHGVVHRDIKPANVMVGEFGEVLLMDWGIAVDVSEVPSPDREAIHVGRSPARAGTPRYMAPEQALGKAGLIGPPTDVFLLGAMLYEILTGSPPHRPGTVDEVLDRAAACRIEPPERRAPERRIPRELGRIALAAMAADPAERPPGAAALARAIRDFRTHSQSLRLSESAQDLIARLERPGEVARPERYALHATAIARFDQALQLWPENDAARTGQARAAQALVDEALERGDDGLAASHLDALATNRFADPGRLSAARAALDVRRTSRVRAAGATLFLALAVIAVLLVRDGWLADASRTDEIARQTAAFDDAAMRAWRAVQSGAPHAVSSARSELARPELVGPPRAAARRSRLALAHAVVCWQRRRWAEAVDALASDPAVSAVVPAPGLIRVAGLDAVRPTALATRLLRLATSGASTRKPRAGAAPPPAKEVSPWRSLVLETEPGGSLIAAARSLLELRPSIRIRSGRRPDPTDTGWPRALDHGAVVRDLVIGAVASLGLERSLERGDRAAAALFSPLALPFEARSPDGPGAGIGPGLVRLDDGTWVALGPGGKPLWHALAFSESSTPPDPLPVEGGQVLVAADSRLSRVDASTGRVLGTVWLDGEPLLVWPVPGDRRRVVVDVLDDDRRGEIHSIVVEGDRAVSPVFVPESYSAVYAPLRAASRVVGQVPDPAARQPARPPGVPVPTLQATLAELERDPANAVLASLALERLRRDLSPDLRARLTARVAAADDLHPSLLVRCGAGLERLGEPGLADRLYAAAAARFEKLGGNVDLAIGRPGSPANELRKIGGELFAAGKIDRALALVETGRRLSTFLEGDHRFYLRCDEWLARHGREETRARLAPRIAQSRLAGGMLAMEGSLLLGIDLGLVAMFITPFVLLVLVVRLWIRSCPTERLDLHARGMRTGRDRALAVFTRPLERFRHSLLAYAARRERLALVAWGGIFVLAGTHVVVGVTRIGERAALPAFVTGGVVGSPSFVRFLEERLRDKGAGVPVLRLLADARRARSESDLARQALDRLLELDPGDSVARANRAALDRDRGTGEPPGWTRCGVDDLVRALDGPASTIRRWLGAFVTVLTRTVTDAVPSSDTLPGLARRVAYHAGQAIVVVSLLALLWLPFPVLPLAPASELARLPRPWPAAVLAHPVVRKAGLRVAGLLGILFPGSYSLLAGDPTTGAATLLLLGACWAIRTTVLDGGIIGSLAIPVYDQGYFPDVASLAVYPELVWAARLATLLLVLLYAVSVPVTIFQVTRALRARS